MGNIIIIGIGGFIGAVTRYLVGGSVQKILPGTAFPWGTFIVNVSGCFLFGLFSAYLGPRVHASHSVNSMVFVGFLGAFTTFSTFSNETAQLISSGSNLAGFANIAASLIAGIGALMAGRYLGSLA